MKFPSNPKMRANQTSCWTYRGSVRSETADPAWLTRASIRSPWLKRWTWLAGTAGSCSRCEQLVDPPGTLDRANRHHGCLPLGSVQLLPARLDPGDCRDDPHRSAGSFISAEQLWPGNARARRSTARIGELGTEQNFDGLVRSLEQLVSGSRPLPTSGPDLVAAVLDGIQTTIESIPAQAKPDRVMTPQTELIASHVTALRHLDDRQGGGALSLRYVTHELAGVLDLVRSASYEPEVGRDLLTIVADLAQLAGWMQFDAGETAIAQRYLLLAIRVARAAGDDGRMVNNVGMLTYIGAYSNQGTDALRIIEAATQRADFKPSAPRSNNRPRCDGSCQRRGPWSFPYGGRPVTGVVGLGCKR